MATKHKDGEMYLLQDGTYADPKDCSAGKDGVLRSKNGLAVSITADGEPMTIGKANESNASAAQQGKVGDGPLVEDAEAKSA
jgi:hypothetical protein